MAAAHDRRHRKVSRFDPREIMIVGSSGQTDTRFELYTFCFWQRLFINKKNNRLSYHYAYILLCGHILLNCCVSISCANIWLINSKRYAITTLFTPNSVGCFFVYVYIFGYIVDTLSDSTPSYIGRDKAKIVALNRCLSTQSKQNNVTLMIIFRIQMSDMASSVQHSI